MYNRSTLFRCLSRVRAGLDEFIQLEPRFRPYRESLFSRASLDINPDLQTKDFLAKLGESIDSFCFLLSSYFLSPPSFKVLEYLIRRYKYVGVGG